MKSRGLAANSDVSFTIEEGMVVGLIGPNDAGKTTLLNCITGYHAPSRGDILSKGQKNTGLQPHKVCGLGMARTWQKVRPLVKMKVLDNVIVGALCGALYAISPDADIMEAAQLMHDRKLSGLCVVDGQGLLAGMLTVTDILEAFISTFRNHE